MELMEIIQQIIVDPDGTYEQLDALCEKIDPFIKGLSSKIVDYIEAYASGCDRLCQSRAMAAKKMYDAYRDVGFSKNEALSLVIRDNDRLVEAIKNTRTSANRQQGA